MSEESVLAAITTLRVAVMDRFDRMEARLGNMGEDMSVTLAGVYASRDAVHSVRSELRQMSKEVEALMRKQRVLHAQFHELTKPGDAL